MGVACGIAEVMGSYGKLFFCFCGVDFCNPDFWYNATKFDVVSIPVAIAVPVKINIQATTIDNVTTSERK